MTMPLEVRLPSGVTPHKILVVIEWTNAEGETEVSKIVLIGPFKDYLYTEEGDEYATRLYKFQFTGDRLP